MDDGRWEVIECNVVGKNDWLSRRGYLDSFYDDTNYSINLQLGTGLIELYNSQGGFG